MTSENDVFRTRANLYIYYYFTRKRRISFSHKLIYTVYVKGARMFIHVIAKNY